MCQEGGSKGQTGKESYTVDGNTHNTLWTGSQWITYVNTKQDVNTCDSRIKNIYILPMRYIFDIFCNIQMIEYNYKNTHVFKDDGNTHIRLITDELEDAFPEYNGSLVLGDRTDVDADIIIQRHIVIKFKFLLMKAIQELNEKIVLLENRINILELS